MDLIYTDAQAVDQGVLNAYEFDLSYGAEENDFELVIAANEATIEPDSVVYIEGTENGGMVGGIKASTNGETVTYTGRTWHGILNSKVIEPDNGADYLTVSGDANAVLYSVIARMGVLKTSGLQLFDVSTVTPHVISNAGVVSSNTDWRTSTYIAVPGVNKIRVSWESSQAYFQANFSYYDSDYQFISRENVAAPMYTHVFTVPDRAAFFRFGYSVVVNGVAVTRSNIMVTAGEGTYNYEPFSDGASGLFSVSGAVSGIDIPNYRFTRYCKGYDGIRALLASHGAKLHIEWKDKAVQLSAVPVVDYTEVPLDGDIAALTVEQYEHKVNHLVCLGKGELAAREVVHLYIDADGNIGDVQVYFGLDEVAEVYENTATEDLRGDGIKKLKDIRDIDKANINLSEADGLTYDIGDIVGATEYKSGISVAAAVTQKIVQITNGVVRTEYKAGS